MKKFSKRLLTFVLACSMVFGLSGMTAFAEETSDPGISTLAAPEQNVDGQYELAGVEDLEWFADQVNNQGNTAIDGILVKDIDASASETFAPIGKNTVPFTGTFDGDGYTITIDIEGTTYEALFGAVNSDNASVSNLTVDGSVSGTYIVGGIVGYAQNVRITNCVNNATVTATPTGSQVSRVGGIAGQAYSGSITNCINNGAIEGKNEVVGGIVGRWSNTAMTIEDCGNDGSVTSTSGYAVGGIVGIVEASGGAGISGCYNKGDIQGMYGVGGINGYSEEAVTIDSCYNTGNITASEGTASQASGGIVGSGPTLTLTNVFNTGDVNATYAGALAGGGTANSSSITITNGYYQEDKEGAEGATASGALGEVTLTDVSSKTADDIMSEEFVGLINGNEKFKKGCEHPLLTWEADATHTLGEEATWDWADDYSSATCTRTCTVCGGTVTVKAEITSETEGDKTIYTATAEFPGNSTETDTKEVINVDKDALQAEYDEDSKLIQGDYTEATWATFATALSNAETVLLDPDASQDDVDTALGNLVSAKAGLDPVEADKDELEEAIDKAEALTYYDYTASSWAVLQEALEAAKAADADQNALQSAVNAVTEELQAAIAALEQVEADKDVLDAAIAAAKALEEGQASEDYTPDSWDKFVTALADAQSVSNDPDAKQSEVDAAELALLEAITDLEFVEKVDKSVLNEVIEVVSALNNDDGQYTDTSWTNLLTALDAAQGVAENDEATQEDVDNATVALAEALANLEFAEQPAEVDKSVLNEVIEVAAALSNEDGKYTADSWKALQDALTTAQGVAENEEETQEDVNDATVALVEALVNLEPEEQPAEVDKSVLNAVITTAADLNNDDNKYTDTSWTNLQTALDAAQGVADNDEATQEEVDKATTDLVDALAGLEPEEQPVEVDKSVLGAVITAAADLNNDDNKYTDTSWTNLQTALDAAQGVLTSDEATQEEVDNATTALVEALANLEPEEQPAAEVDKSVLDAAVTAAESLNNDDGKYTTDSWSALQDALTAAQGVADNKEATQEDVNNATTALVNALANLEPAETSEPTPTPSAPKNGLCRIVAGELWGYYVDDVVDTSYTGFVKNDNGTWYVENGYVNFAKNSVYKDTKGEIGNAGTWYYVVGNKVQYGFTGLAHYRNANGWWYIANGVVDFTHNGVDKNQNGWWYVTGGKVQFGFTGLANYKNENGWWYISGGKVDFSHNGVDKNKNGWWYIKGGKVDFTYTGRASNQNGTWNVVNGKVVF